MNDCSGVTVHIRDQDAWSDKDIYKLVCLYRRQPCLWKRNDPFYLDGDRRRQAYEMIHRDMAMCLHSSTAMNITFIEIMMMLRKIRRLYVCELKMVLESESTCCRYEPKAKWFYELHEFLWPYLDYDEIIKLHVGQCLKFLYS